MGNSDAGPLLNLGVSFNDQFDAPTPKFRGVWSEILFRPDLFKSDLVAIGVVLKDDRSQDYKFKLVKSLDPLCFFWGDESKDTFDFLLKVLYEELGNQTDPDKISKNLSIQFKTYVCEDEDKMIEGLFESSICPKLLGQ